MSEAEIPQDSGRLHVAAAVQGALGHLRQMAFVIGVLVVRGTTSDESLMELAVIALLVPGLLVAGVVRWVRFRYWFTPTGVEAVDGAFVRKRVSIPYDRIRAVEENEGIVHQVFGVTRLQIKTGATGTQLDLSALDRETAEAVRERVRARMSEGVEERARVVESADASRTLSLRELLWVGLTTRGIGASALVTTWAYDMIASWLGIEQGVGLIGVFVVTFAVLSSVFGVASTVLKFWGFGVERTGDRLDVRHGLFNRQTIQLEAARVQAVRLRQNLLQQLVGGGSVFVEVVGHSEEKGAASEMLPWIRAADFDAFVAAFVPELAGRVEVARPPGRALGRFLVAPSVVTSILAASVTWSAWELAGSALGALAWLALPFVLVSGVLGHRQTGAGTRGRLLRVESRDLFARHVVLLPRRAVRASSSVANPLQRWRELATMGVVVATGARGRTFRAPNMDAARASTLTRWATSPVPRSNT